MDNYRGTLFANDLDVMPVIQGAIMKKSEVEQDIIPVNSNLAKRRRKKPVYKVATETSSKVEAFDYKGDVDPFKNVPHFMRYYRAFLQVIAQLRVKFDAFDIDSLYASQILDLLQDNNRSNKVFLNGWLLYFCQYKLKGKKASKIKYTSMKAFKETFEEYNCRHMDI